MGKKHTPLHEILIVLAVLLALIGGVFYLIFHYWAPPTPANIAIAAGILAAYLLVCYIFNPPQVDGDDLDFGTLMFDNPFSFQDDIIRWKFYIFLLMFPGILVSHILAALVSVLRGK